MPQAELISAEDLKNPGSPRTLSVGRRRRCWSSNWRLPCGIRSSNCGGSRENVMDPLPKRKPNRLAGYDYSQSGAYFITICAKGRHTIFGTVCVGRDDLGAPYEKLSEYGTMVENHICTIEQAYSNVTVEKFVVMPNHVHLLFAITRRASGAPRSSRPTKLVPRIVAALKRFTNKEAGLDLWQASYHDHIVRSEADYLRIWSYIDTNPAKWREDCYYTETEG